MQQNNRNEGRGPRRDDRRDRDSDSYGGFKSNYGTRRFNSEPKEMHKVTCSDCGNECEVPFKPTEGRPVYCKDCFSKHKPKRDY